MTLAMFEQKLHVVSGKGGVGKSVVACALADAFARAGHKTLLCQINTPDTHGALLGIEPPGPTVQAARPGLYAVNITPREALMEYARMVLKFDTVVRAVFDNRVTKSFLRFLPALQELNMLGKVWYHTIETNDDGSPAWDRIVVDAPSTGHGLSLMSTARVVHDLSRGHGPLADKTAEMQKTLLDPAVTRLHVVSLPEEMPTNEALDLLRRAKTEHVAPLGNVIVNQLTPPLFADVPGGALDTDESDPIVARALDIACERKQREADEAEQYARLDARHTGCPRLTIPRIDVAPFGLDAIHIVQQHLGLGATS